MRALDDLDGIAALSTGVLGNFRGRDFDVEHRRLLHDDVLG
jgi:hypothetical protein